MSIVNDIWENDVIITKDYVSHRNRLIDVHMIQTFQVKGKRLYINTFKQNTSAPTMCIFFESKEKAVNAFETMRDVNYGSPQLVRKETQPQLSSYQMMLIFFVTFSPLFALLFLMFAFASIPVAKASVLFLPS